MNVETYTLNLKDSSAKHLETALRQLKTYRSQGRYKSYKDIAWEIKLYKWILAHPEREKMARKYLETRHENGILSKRQTVKLLEWDIPE